MPSIAPTSSCATKSSNGDFSIESSSSRNECSLLRYVGLGGGEKMIIEYILKMEELTLILSFAKGLGVNGLEEDDVMHNFVKERELNGDFIAKVSDAIWLREVIKAVDREASVLADATQLVEECAHRRRCVTFRRAPLGSKHQTTPSGISDNSAPVNKKLTAKEVQNDSERRKRLNLLRYEALKRELLLLTVTIGTACGGYCLVTLSFQAAVSYMTGVLFSCLYLQLLYQHADNMSRETVPDVFKRKKSKKIGIRSQDLEDSFEKLVKGSGIALSSSRLMIPVAIYGLWELSQHFSHGFFEFQLVPAMVGIFAYKAAALVQVYRDNEDLQLIFPDSGEE
ncbi:hypothetical protein RJ640_007306 [Escallonia rubra]|uniref:Uncharacterized protein n=1 Tax=Escallonia rubra TaxID=112253 RepID=A0AA88RSC5_9ASTE|nr:hypothetical protein RJ640_007306 [Escallonia rubra]